MDQAQAPTPKQQISELLRTGSNFIVATPPNPTVDQATAALGLTNLLRKINKNAQGVASGRVPRELDFLPSYTLASKPEAQRDFVIALDTSKTEADKLKYTTEGKQLKVYITPFNGNFTKDDVSFDYGDYHVDAVVALGIEDPKQLANVFGEDKDLVSKARVVTINNKGGAKDGSTLAWYEDASSLSEMVMSMSEALGSGILDKEIATVLLTGIIAATEHFQAPNTTPKVMTMAAQLMAAGADQSQIMKQLEKANSKPKPQADTKPKAEPHKAPKADKKLQDGRIEMKPAQESSLKSDEPSALGITPAATEPTASTDKPQPAPPTPDLPPQPTQPASPPKPDNAQQMSHTGGQPANQPLSPFMAHQFGADASPKAAPASPPAQPQPTPAAPPQPVPQPQGNDVEAARRAVEEAARAAGDTHQQLQSHYGADAANQPTNQQPPQEANNQPPQPPQTPTQ